jgi:O-antigen/teichoic acid export membrane protein
VIPSTAKLRGVTHHWAVRGAAVVMAALAVEYVTQFGRSVALSHLLGPTEFGIGSALVILWVLIDMSTGVGADRYLVQAAEGDTREALAAAHTVTLIRNSLSACLILTLAVPTADILGVPQARNSFLWLAAVPLIRGFEHLGVTQNQRHDRFAPWAMALGSTHIFGLMVVTAAAFVLRDHRAVLCSLAAQAAGLVLSTHFLARSSYRLSINRPSVLRALRFGLPLTVNGLALAAIGQVDRLAVGSFLGVVQLGRYGLATMLFFLPVSLVARIMSATLTPRLSAAWHRSPNGEFPALFKQVSYGAAVLAVLLSTLVALAGNPLVAFIFGRVYIVEDSFFAILALVVLMKFAKITLNFGGMAMGKTIDVMLSNVPNSCGLAVTIFGLMWVPHLSTAAIGALVGETLGAASAFLLLKRHLHREASMSWLPILMIIPVPCVAAGWCGAMNPDMRARAVALGLAGLVVLASLAFMPRRGGLQPASS